LTSRERNEEGDVESLKRADLARLYPVDDWYLLTIKKTIMSKRLQRKMKRVKERGSGIRAIFPRRGGRGLVGFKTRPH